LEKDAKDRFTLRSSRPKVPKVPKVALIK